MMTKIQQDLAKKQKEFDDYLEKVLNQYAKKNPEPVEILLVAKDEQEREELVKRVEAHNLIVK